MPRKPKLNHPVRQVRTCLGYTQAAFAKQIGCSAIAVQRIENGTLPLSRRLAYAIMEATGANPASLLAGPNAEAQDMFGCEFTKEALDSYRRVAPCDEKEMKFLLMKIFHQLQLLYVVANRTAKFRTYVINDALQRTLLALANDFDLTKSINRFLIENGRVDKRNYRVSDLRKFPGYAQILGYKDTKRTKPDKIVSFVLPKGWIRDYFVHEKPVLPHGADMKLRPNATYILDDERFIPPEVQEAVDQALYWEILDFRPDLTYPPQEA